MTHPIAKKLRLIYGIVLGLFAGIAGICLIAACIQIYRSGGEPVFTAEKVALAFGKIAVPVWAFLALILGGYVLNFFLPPQEKKKKAAPSVEMTLTRYYKNYDLSGLTQILQLRKTRCLYRYILFGILLICSVVFLIYGANPANFHQTEITASMKQAMALFFPCLAIPYIAALILGHLTRLTMIKELALIREAISEGLQKKAPQPASQTATLTPTQLVRYGLLLLAVGCFLYGYLAGGTLDVLTKAVNICTECVGLG